MVLGLVQLRGGRAEGVEIGKMDTEGHLTLHSERCSDPLGSCQQKSELPKVNAPFAEGMNE